MHFTAKLQKLQTLSICFNDLTGLVQQQYLCTFIKWCNVWEVHTHQAVKPWRHQCISICRCVHMVRVHCCTHMRVTDVQMPALMFAPEPGLAHMWVLAEGLTPEKCTKWLQVKGRWQKSNFYLESSYCWLGGKTSHLIHKVKKYKH